MNEHNLYESNLRTHRRNPSAPIDLYKVVQNKLKSQNNSQSPPPHSAQLNSHGSYNSARANYQHHQRKYVHLKSKPSVPTTNPPQPQAPLPTQYYLSQEHFSQKPIQNKIITKIKKYQLQALNSRIPFNEGITQSCEETAASEIQQNTENEDYPPKRRVSQFQAFRIRSTQRGTRYNHPSNSFNNFYSNQRQSPAPNMPVQPISQHEVINVVKQEADEKISNSTEEQENKENCHQKMQSLIEESNPTSPFVANQQYVSVRKSLKEIAEKADSKSFISIDKYLGGELSMHELEKDEMQLIFPKFGKNINLELTQKINLNQLNQVQNLKNFDLNLNHNNQKDDSHKFPIIPLNQNSSRTNYKSPYKSHRFKRNSKVIPISNRLTPTPPKYRISKSQFRSNFRHPNPHEKDKIQQNAKMAKILRNKHIPPVYMNGDFSSNKLVHPKKEINMKDCSSFLSKLSLINTNESEENGKTILEDLHRVNVEDEINEINQVLNDLDEERKKKKNENEATSSIKPANQRYRKRSQSTLSRQKCSLGSKAIHFYNLMSNLGESKLSINN